MGPYDHAYIKSLWFQHAFNPINVADIHSTQEWSSKELGFFKVNIVPVPSPSWHEYIAPIGHLTEKAQILTDCTLSAGAFNTGAHLVEGVPEIVEEFGDMINIIYNHHTAEACVDRLAHLLLRACNTNRKVLVDVPQMKQISVKVGVQVYKSIPDACVVSRFINYEDRPPIFIVVEDKAKTHVDGKAVPVAPEIGEFQVIGEMIAVASYNYFQVAKIPQTVFAMRIIADAISFYRADFSADYLESIKKGAPSSNLIVFRLFGGSSMLVSESAQRPEILRVLCSIYHASMELEPFVKPGATVPAPITTARLALLNGL